MLWRLGKRRRFLNYLQRNNLERYRELIKEGSLLIGCPKFDDPDFALNRLTDIMKTSQLNTLTVVHMEVPCCAGYWHLARRAMQAAGSSVALRQVVVGVSGQTISSGEQGA